MGIMEKKSRPVVHWCHLVAMAGAERGRGGERQPASGALELGRTRKRLKLCGVCGGAGGIIFVGSGKRDTYFG